MHKYRHSIAPKSRRQLTISLISDARRHRMKLIKSNMKAKPTSAREARRHSTSSVSGGIRHLSRLRRKNRGRAFQPERSSIFASSRASWWGGGDLLTMRPLMTNRYFDPSDQHRHGNDARSLCLIVTFHFWRRAAQRNVHRISLIIANLSRLYQAYPSRNDIMMPTPRSTCCMYGAVKR